MELAITQKNQYKTPCVFLHCFLSQNIKPKLSLQLPSKHQAAVKTSLHHRRSFHRHSLPLSKPTTQPIADAIKRCPFPIGTGVELSPPASFPFTDVFPALLQFPLFFIKSDQRPIRRDGVYGRPILLGCLCLLLCEELPSFQMTERWLVVELQKNSAKWTRVVDEVVRIEKKNFPKHESLAKSFDEELKKKNSGLLYAEVAAGGDVAGYVMYSMPSSLCATITKLAVKEGNRRQGLGEALMKAAIEKCRSRKVHRISLHVDPERVPAMTLYKRLGFQVDALIEGYYSSDRNAYRMYIDFDSN